MVSRGGRFDVTSRRSGIRTRWVSAPYRAGQRWRPTARSLNMALRTSSQVARPRARIDHSNGSLAEFTDAELVSLLNSLRQLVYGVHRSSVVRRRPAHLRTSEALLLRQVQLAPGASISALAHRLHTDASAISVIVASLARRRLLTRGKAEHDGRVAVVRVTAAGLSALAQLPPPALLRSSSAVQALTPEARRALAHRLVRLAKVLNGSTSAGRLARQEAMRPQMVRPRHR